MGGAMTLQSFAPHWSVGLLYSALWACSSDALQLYMMRFEDRVREVFSAIVDKRETLGFWETYLGGGSPIVIVFDAAMWFSMLFVLIFPFAYGYDAGWRPALGLVVIAYIAEVAFGVASELSGLQIPSDTLVTAVLLTLILTLAFQVSWFGLFSRSATP